MIIIRMWINNSIFPLTWTFLSYKFKLYWLSTWVLNGLKVWILYFWQGVAQLLHKWFVINPTEVIKMCLLNTNLRLQFPNFLPFCVYSLKMFPKLYSHTILFGHLEAHTGVLVDLESLKEEIICQKYRSCSDKTYIKILWFGRKVAS